MLHTPSNKEKRDAHLKRRRSQGQSYSKLGEEFGVHKSTAHRIDKSNKKEGNMGELDSKERKGLSKSTFGLPGERKYPMPDKSHAANAKARASQMEKKGKLSAADKSKIDAKANKILAKSKAAKDIKSDRGNFKMK